MLSRSPSPPKSPRRIALSSKDNNIRHQQITKSSTPQLSPAKDNRSFSPRRSISPQRSVSPVSPKRSISPEKADSNISNFFKNKEIPQLGFTIFSDDKDYSTELQLASNLKVTTQDENDNTYNKENVNITPVIRNLLTSRRKVLGDLNIKVYSGFIKFPKEGEITPDIQLTETWTNNKQIRIPSYVTPPRKDRIKYISFENEKIKPKKRSNSQSDIDTRKVVKKLVFDIHKD